jgi:ATP-dependent Clp protease protease subunit
MLISINDNVVQMSGTIWGGEGAWIVRELQPVLDANTEVHIHLNTSGGSVFDGNQIYNALKTSKAKIHFIIESLVASMGTIFMLSGDTISMRENAYLMVHAPSGYCDGTAKEFTSTAKVLQMMEKNFLAKYSKKTGKTVDELAYLMEGDNWFSADEALALGLVDEIIDPDLIEMDVTALQKLNFTALLKERDITASIDATTQPIKTKMKKEVVAALGLTGVTEQSSDTAVIEAIQAQQKTAIDAKDKRILELEAKAIQDGKTAISGIVATAVAAGKITALQVEKYEGIGASAGIETLNAVLEDMNAKSVKPASVTAQIHGNGTSVPKGSKTWDELSKEKDALENLRASDPTEFAAVFKAKFKKEYKD